MESGAKHVVFYPVEPDSPGHRFMGFKTTFEKSGFKFIKITGKRRNVMLYELKGEMCGNTERFSEEIS
ncbi:MAG: hypothetical protein WBY47_09470 [Desulfobacterales bacterium]|jgi:hypothetical protein